MKKNKTIISILLAVLLASVLILATACNGDEPNGPELPPVLTAISIDGAPAGGQAIFDRGSSFEVRIVPTPADAPIPHQILWTSGNENVLQVIPGAAGSGTARIVHTGVGSAQITARPILDEDAPHVADAYFRVVVNGIMINNAPSNNTIFLENSYLILNTLSTLPAVATPVWRTSNPYNTSFGTAPEISDTATGTFARVWVRSPHHPDRATISVEKYVGGILYRDSFVLGTARPTALITFDAGETVTGPDAIATPRGGTEVSIVADPDLTPTNGSGYVLRVQATTAGAWQGVTIDLPFVLDHLSVFNVSFGLRVRQLRLPYECGDDCDDHSHNHGAVPLGTRLIWGVQNFMPNVSVPNMGHITRYYVREGDNITVSGQLMGRGSDQLAMYFFTNDPGLRFDLAIDNIEVRQDFATSITIQNNPVGMVQLSEQTRQLGTTNTFGAAVEWISSNPAVIHVTQTGLITYRATGQATISVRILGTMISHSINLSVHNFDGYYPVEANILMLQTIYDLDLVGRTVADLYDPNTNTSSDVFFDFSADPTHGVWDVVNNGGYRPNFDNSRLRWRVEQFGAPDSEGRDTFLPVSDNIFTINNNAQGSNVRVTFRHEGVAHNTRKEVVVNMYYYTTTGEYKLLNSRVFVLENGMIRFLAPNSTQLPSRIDIANSSNLERTLTMPYTGGEAFDPARARWVLTTASGLPVPTTDAEIVGNTLHVRNSVWYRMYISFEYRYGPDEWVHEYGRGLTIIDTATEEIGTVSARGGANATAVAPTDAPFGAPDAQRITSGHGLGYNGGFTISRPGTITNPNLFRAGYSYLIMFDITIVSNPHSMLWMTMGSMGRSNALSSNRFAVPAEGVTTTMTTVHNVTESVGTEYQPEIPAGNDTEAIPAVNGVNGSIIVFPGISAGVAQCGWTVIVGNVRIIEFEPRWMPEPPPTPEVDADSRIVSVGDFFFEEVREGTPDSIGQWNPVIVAGNSHGAPMPRIQLPGANPGDTVNGHLHNVSTSGQGDRNTWGTSYMPGGGLIFAEPGTDSSMVGMIANLSTGLPVGTDFVVTMDFTLLYLNNTAGNQVVFTFANGVVGLGTHSQTAFARIGESVDGPMGQQPALVMGMTHTLTFSFRTTGVQEWPELRITADRAAGAVGWCGLVFMVNNISITRAPIA